MLGLNEIDKLISRQKRLQELKELLASEEYPSPEILEEMEDLETDVEDLQTKLNSLTDEKLEERIKKSTYLGGPTFESFRSLNPNVNFGSVTRTILAGTQRGKSSLLKRGIDLASQTHSSEEIISIEAINQQPRTQEATTTIIFSTEKELTPAILAKDVVPFLQAIVDIQHIINEIRQRPKHEIQVTQITKGSIGVTLSGATSAIELIMSVVVPWQYNHAKAMAKLLETEKSVQIESAKTDILARRLQISKERQEKESVSIEFEKQRIEVEKLKLEKEKLRLELHREKIKLALEILDQIDPNLTETDKIDYATRLLRPLEVMISSDIEPQLKENDFESY